MPLRWCAASDGCKERDDWRTVRPKYSPYYRSRQVRRGGRGNHHREPGPSARAAQGKPRRQADAGGAVTEGAPDELGAARCLPRDGEAHASLLPALRHPREDWAPPREAFALQPGDLDVRGRTLRIQRALSLGRIKPTKTYEERAVDVTPDLMQTIQQHLTWLKMEALKHGTGEPEWLFPNEEGKLMDESRVRKTFKRALQDAKLPAFRLYDLRHTYASLLLAERAPITYGAEQLGHANPSTTLRYYAKWIPSKGQRWADVLDRVATTVRDTVTSAGGRPRGSGWFHFWNQNLEPKRKRGLLRCRSPRN